MKTNDQDTLEKGHKKAIDFLNSSNWASMNDWVLFHAALAEYRFGNLNNARHYAQESLTASHRSAAHEISLNSLNNLLLSLIYYRLNDLPKSASTLKIARYNQAEFRKLKRSFHDLYLSELLLEERESLDSKQSSE